MTKNDKLFTAISPMPSFNSYKDECVIVYWYRVDKTRDGFKYDEIIETPIDVSTCDLERGTTNRILFGIKDYSLIIT